jgi:hypothetical protein
MTRVKPWEVSDELWAVVEPLLPTTQRCAAAALESSPCRNTWSTRMTAESCQRVPGSHMPIRCRRPFSWVSRSPSLDALLTAQGQPTDITHDVEPILDRPAHASSRWAVHHTEDLRTPELT